MESGKQPDRAAARFVALERYARSVVRRAVDCCRVGGRNSARRRGPWFGGRVAGASAQSPPTCDETEIGRGARPEGSVPEGGRTVVGTRGRRRSTRPISATFENPGSGRSHQGQCYSSR